MYEGQHTGPDVPPAAPQNFPQKYGCMRWKVQPHACVLATQIRKSLQRGSAPNRSRPSKAAGASTHRTIGLRTVRSTNELAVRNRTLCFRPGQRRLLRRIGRQPNQLHQTHDLIQHSNRPDILKRNVGRRAVSSGPLLNQRSSRVRATRFKSLN